MTRFVASRPALPHLSGWTVRSKSRIVVLMVLVSASARRARTVARDLDGFEGLARKSDQACGFYEQTFEAPWAERTVSATAAHAHPHLARHALLSVMKPDRSVLAAVIIALPVPPPPPVNSSRRLLEDSCAAPVVVSAPLTRGGRLVGTLTATVWLLVET